MISAKLFQTSPAQTSEHHGDRDLCDDQGGAKPDRLRPGGAFASVPQGIDRVDFDGMPGGGKPGEDPGQESADAGDDENRKIDRNLVAPWNPAFGKTREKKVESPCAEQDPADAAKDYEQERFHEQSARDGGAAGAEGKAAGLQLHDAERKREPAEARRHSRM